MTISNLINKATLLLSCLFCANFSHATLNADQKQEKQIQPNTQMQWNKYIQTGVIVLTPMVSFGVRGDNHYHGVDVALDFATPFRPDLLTILKLNLNYLKFFKAKETSRWYFGPGVSYMYMHVDFDHPRHGYLKDDIGVILPFQLTLGKEKMHRSGKKTFLQAQITSIGYIPSEGRWTSGIFPTLTYGWLF